MAAKKQKYLNEYEENLIRMSYRYCIGKHTIAARIHANDIIKNSYSSIDPAHREFIAQDIQQELNRCLGMSFEEYTEINGIDDNVLVWYEASKCFSSKSHEVCAVRNSETGEITEVQYFWSYRRTNWDSKNYQKVRISLKEYLKNPVLSYYIKDEDIINGDISEMKPLIRKKQKMPKNMDVDVLDSI